jgi:hypothetical protein
MTTSIWYIAPQVGHKGLEWISTSASCEEDDDTDIS